MRWLVVVVAVLVLCGWVEWLRVRVKRQEVRTEHLIDLWTELALRNTALEHRVAGLASENTSARTT